MPHPPAPAAPTTAGAQASGANAALVLADGSVFWGRGAGATGTVVGEVCFNTATTGYQEILTDPSYAGQIVTFTFPHIGNVGANPDDMESATPAALGCVLRAAITEPANWRAAESLDPWLADRGVVAITGIDTRRLARRIRDGGAASAALTHVSPDIPSRAINTRALAAEAAAWPGLEGMDLARAVTCGQTHAWEETTWTPGAGYGRQEAPSHHVVAVDFGAKRNILRCLAAAGCRVTVVPATASAADVLAHRPDGVFLSNGPGDPAATGAYAVPMIQGVLEAGPPLFGICLGHQMLALALGARTTKMHHGHRGANHPVKDLATGRVETHTSLFDGTVEGLRLEGRTVFSVQYHPEASPGPWTATICSRSSWG